MLADPAVGHIAPDHVVVAAAAVAIEVEESRHQPLSLAGRVDQVGVVVLEQQVVGVVAAEGVVRHGAGGRPLIVVALDDPGPAGEFDGPSLDHIGSDPAAVHAPVWMVRGASSSNSCRFDDSGLNAGGGWMYRLVMLMFFDP